MSEKINLEKCCVIDYNSHFYHQSIELRDKVLRKPLNIEFTEEELQQDEVDHHLVYIESKQLIGVLVLKSIDENTFKMRQVAVDDQLQKGGIGTSLVKYAEQFSKEKKKNKIILSARDIAIPFYLKLGYEIVGDGFTEVGIPHHKMQKKLLANK